MRTKNIRSGLFALTILAPQVALAGGYIIPGENARDLALSESAISNEDGAEAVVQNPAGLAGKDGLDLSVSGEMLVNRTDWSDPNLGSSKMGPRYNFPPSATISFGGHLPNDMAYGIGVGFSLPAGGSISWPNGWQGQEFVQSVNLKVYESTVGVAFQPLPYVKLGASYIRYQATEDLHQEINFLDHDGDAHLGLSGGTNTWAVAGEAHAPSIPLALGIVYKRKGDAHMTGDVHFNDVPASFQGLLHDQSVTEDPFVVPSTLDVGASYDLVPGLRVMADFTYEAWSTYHNDTFVGSDGFTVIVPRDYKDAYVYRFGAEWAHVPFLPILTLRVGGERSISDQPAETASPSLTDGSSWVVSAGVGLNVVPSLRIDLGFQHAFFDDVTATGNNTLPGTYKTAVDLLSLGVNWRLDLLGCGCKH